MTVERSRVLVTVWEVRSSIPGAGIEFNFSVIFSLFFHSFGAQRSNQHGLVPHVNSKGGLSVLGNERSRKRSGSQGLYSSIMSIRNFTAAID